MDQLIFGTQIEVITAIFIVLEFCMFLFQLALFALRPSGYGRIWYLLLLSLMLLYNVTGGLFPDPAIHSVPVAMQEMICYGTGFLMASYFPFYFYKAFDLKALRWHALFGVPLFLALPYVIFFVVAYAINGKLDVDIRYGMIVPFIYALVLLWVMFRAIREKYKKNRDREQYFDEIALYCAVSPWAALAFFGLVEESQLVEVFCTNTGIIAISFMFIKKTARVDRAEHRLLKEVQATGVMPEVFAANCMRNQLSPKETEVITLLRQGYTSAEIGEMLFISKRTVTTHLQNMYAKTGTRSMLQLIRKLERKIIE